MAQKAIIYRNDKVLLTRDPRTPDTWELPGGRLNIGEDSKDGLKRELLEELGVESEIEQAVFLKQFHQGNENKQLSLVIVYKATISENAVFTVDNREVAELGWFSQNETLSFPLFPEYLEALKVFYKV